jgi:hypothetical protein
MASEDVFKISNDRYFDYMSVQDFLNVMNHVLSNIDDDYPEVIDCVYLKKLKISELLELFCDLNNIRKNFTVESVDRTSNYVGNPWPLYALESKGLKLDGIEQGLKEYVQD